MTVGLPARRDCALDSLDGQRILRIEIISGGDNAPTWVIIARKPCHNSSELPASEGALAEHDPGPVLGESL